MKTNMIYSKGKKYDQGIRADVLECLRVAVKRGDKESTAIFAAESLRLKKKIETYDYRYEDAEVALVDALQHRWEKMVS